jgi:DNA repair protein RecO (recombination protein O)
MPIEKSEALVLRVILFRDTSKILTVYTAEHGLVSLLAKGVRGPKPRFGASLELFACVDVVYYHRDARELQLLSQASLLDAHLGLSAHPERYVYGTGVLEFLLKVLSGQEPPGRLYALSQRALEVLESAPRSALAAVFRAFELKAVAFLGHRPELYSCADCGRRADEPARWRFSPLTGGIVCGDCAAAMAGAVELSEPALRTLRRMLTAKLDELAADPPDPADTNAAARVLESFLQSHLERYESLRSLHMAQSFAAGANGRGQAGDAKTSQSASRSPRSPSSADSGGK